MRRFTHDIYWERPFRPLAELRHTELARQRQIPTVEVLAAGVEHVAFGLYRGLFISREAEGFLNFWEWIRSNPLPEERCTGIEMAAHVIKRLHTTGVYHADLNLTNILVAPKSSQPQALVIDFDRARMFPASLPAYKRKRNLQRLRRSLNKLDPNAENFSSADLEIFCRAYQMQNSG